MITNILLGIILIVLCFIALEIYAIGEEWKDRKKESNYGEERNY